MKIVEVKSRTCKKCGETKPLDEFRQNLSCLYGREPVCKECKNKAAKLKRTKAEASDFVERTAKKASAMVDDTIKAVKQEWEQEAAAPPEKGKLFNLKRPKTKDSFKIVLIDEPTPTGDWLAARCNELTNVIYARITSGRYDEKLESWAQELARTIKARNEFERVEAKAG
jgi:hypothetical protein